MNLTTPLDGLHGHINCNKILVCTHVAEHSCIWQVV